MTVLFNMLHTITADTCFHDGYRLTVWWLVCSIRQFFAETPQSEPLRSTQSTQSCSTLLKLNTVEFHNIVEPNRCRILLFWDQGFPVTGNMDDLVNLGTNLLSEGVSSLSEGVSSLAEGVSSLAEGVSVESSTSNCNNYYTYNNNYHQHTWRLGTKLLSEGVSALARRRQQALGPSTSNRNNNKNHQHADATPYHDTYAGAVANMVHSYGSVERFKKEVTNFEQFSRQLSTQLTLHGDATGGDAMATAERVFRQFGECDRDGSGYISVEEFVVFSSKMDVSEESARAMFVVANVNGDGARSFWGVSIIRSPVLYTVPGTNLSRNINIICTSLFHQHDHYNPVQSGTGYRYVSFRTEALGLLAATVRA